MTEVEAYRTCGYVVFHDVLPREEVARTRRDLLDLFGADDDQPVAAMRGLLVDDELAYRARLGAMARVASVHRLLLRDEILGCIGELGVTTPMVPTGPVVHLQADELRLPGGYHGLGAHQDWPSMQGSLDAVIVWVPLVPVDERTNPVEVVDGSHLRGLLPGVEGPNELVVDPDVLVDVSWTPVTADPGDVVVMSSWLVHRSGGTGTAGRLRLACSLRFDNADEPTWRDRGYPTAYRRRVERAPITPDFPSREVVRATFA